MEVDSTCQDASREEEVPFLDASAGQIASNPFAGPERRLIFAYEVGGCRGPAPPAHEAVVVESEGWPGHRPPGTRDAGTAQGINQPRVVPYFGFDLLGDQGPSPRR